MSNKPQLNAGAVVDASTLLDELPLSQLQYIIFVLCFILNMIDGMDVVILSYSASSIMADLSIAPIQMGGVFSVGLIGMALGGLILGSYADKIGRRKLVLGGLMLIAAGVILGALSQSATQLMITRLVAGLGIGGLLASVTAITAEYAPLKVRNIVIMAVTAGYPLGALLTGLISAWAVPEIGWRATMLTAGGLTIIMVPICFLLLPESLFFLARQSNSNASRNVNSVLRRMKHPEIAVNVELFTEKQDKFRLGNLFNSKYRSLSIRLWAGLACTFMTMYYLLSWIPKIAMDSGLTSDKAIIAGAVFSGGGFIGVISAGFLANRFGFIRSIMTYCIIAFIMMVTYSVYRGDIGIVLAIAFLMGFTVQGAVGTFYGAAARAYPVHMKSTGVGWTIGIGRIGAIVGPYLGGVLLAMELPLVINFTIYGAIMLVGAIIIFPIRDRI